MAETFDEADILIQKQQYEYAIFLLSDCINTNFRKPEALIKRATCYMDMHRFREAIDDLEKSIKLDRTIPSAYVKQSKCYVSLGDLQNAINTLTFLSQIEENNAYAKCELQKLKDLKEKNKRAERSFEQKKYQDVINIMDECLAKAKTCVRFKLMKAECFVYLGKHEDALSTVNDVLFTNKDDLEAICIRAINLMYQEKYTLGIAELREVMSISPRAKEIYRNYKRVVECLKLANKEFEKNNLVEAERLYREVYKLDMGNNNKNKQILLKLAQILLRQKEYERCIDTATEVLEMDETNIKALEFRAKCNNELEEYDLAIEDYKAILAISNNNSEIQRNLKITQDKAKLGQDNYKILGVSRNSTVAEIKKAYKALARIHHPDKGTNISKYREHRLNTKFAKINKAYNELLKLFRD